MTDELRKDKEEEPAKIPDVLPVLPLRDIVIFPFMIVPLYVSRDRSIKAVDQALADNRMILLVAQKRQDDEDPGPEDVYSVGTVALNMHMLKLPDGRIRVLVQGIGRARIQSFEEGHPHLQARVDPVVEPEVADKGLETEALMRNVKAALEKSANLGKPISPEVIVIATNMEEPGRLADLTASNLDLKVEGAQEILEAVDPVERLRRVHELMAKELAVLAMQQEISSQAKGEMDRSQREFFLRQQLKAIQSELGEGNELAEEIAGLKEKAAKAKMPKPVMEEVERQLKKLERMHPDSAETATLRNWLDWMVTLPWGKSTKDNLDLKEAQKILDEDHYGLEKVKERIVEYLAVRKLKDKMKGPLLCFVGPPGVGKTSLGKSIARALGRKFVRLSVGGVKDEAEIRGHRRTYVGAMPGTIIRSIRDAESMNPVILIDEIDKLGSDFRGDPASAMLEVLDPEQNKHFRDHYLDLPFDLSKVLFICTANTLDTIPAPLLDRMDVIQLSGYTEDEKFGIAKRYLVPKQVEAHGLGGDQITITDRALRLIIRQYTREAGVRNLERRLADVLRKAARKVAEGKLRGKRVRVDEKRVRTWLGPRRYEGEVRKRTSEPGVATGLAFTAVGGDILFFEATAYPGKGRLTITGQLGDVMQESAQAALSWVRAHAEALGLEPDWFREHDIHLHVPAGAVPKDGPSAGITMATAIASLVRNQPVSEDVGMTGEITLTGQVLPIGGIREKTLAAQRAGLRRIIMPRDNEPDLEELPKEKKQQMEFILVDTIDQVFDAAFDGKGATHPKPSAVRDRQAAASLKDVSKPSQASVAPPRS